MTWDSVPNDNEKDLPDIKHVLQGLQVIINSLPPEAIVRHLAVDPGQFHDVNLAEFFLLLDIYKPGE